MRACNIIKTDDAVYLFSDGASYYGDGTIGAVGQKVSILAHLNCAVSCRGPAGFAEELAQAINTAYGSFEDLVDSFALAVSNFYFVGRDRYARCETGPEVEVYLAGWSEGRNQPESYVVTSHSLYGPVWELQPLGPVAVAPFDADLDARCAALEPGEDIISAGVALMEEQRRLRGPHAGVGTSVAGVGGFCQMTVIRPQSIQTAIVKRWSDKIGEVLGGLSPPSLLSGMQIWSRFYQKDLFKAVGALDSALGIQTSTLRIYPNFIDLNINNLTVRYDNKRSIMLVDMNRIATYISNDNLL